MFTWNRKENSPAELGLGGQSSSLLQLGRNTTSSHADWVFQAIQRLRSVEGIDRAGVWLERAQTGNDGNGHAVSFHGEVWEEGIGTGLAEWGNLSADVPLIAELLQEKHCEYTLEGPRAEWMVGPLVGLGRVLWVPVMVRGAMRGMVLLGSRQRQVALPRGRAELVAAELAILFELEDLRRLAAGRKADLELVRRVRELSREGQNSNMTLGQLAENCTRGTALGGVGTVFALIGERREKGPTAEMQERLILRAQSDDGNFASCLNEPRLASLWRQAIQEQRIAGIDEQGGWREKGIGRLIAIPIAGENECYGAMVAGLKAARLSPEVQERLQLRAALGAEVLQAERRTETEARQENWYRALLESTEKPVLIIDRNGMLSAMSEGAREIFRHTETNDATSPGLRFAERFAAQERERVAQWIENGWQEESAEEERGLEAQLSADQTVRLSRLRRSGDRFWVVGLEKHGARKRLRKGNEDGERLGQTLEWLEEGVAVFDEDGEIVAQNGRFRQILGLSGNAREAPRNLDELIEATAGNFAAPEQFATDWRALAKNSEGGSKQELLMVKPVAHVIDRFARPVLDANGKKAGHVEVYRELTARRMFEGRMAQAEKLAAVGQRVTAIMHELSNPLTTILGTAQRIVSHEEGSAQPAETVKILQQAQRATKLVRGLLDLSRESQPERRLFSLNEMVRRAIDLQKVWLAGKPMGLQLDLAAWLPLVRGNRGQLEEVLLNLLQNAEQAIEHSGKGNTIGVRTSSMGICRVRMEVWDNGPGIPEAVRGRIFEPFFTTKPAGVGTGLGLAIVEGLVHEHGGSIWVQCPAECGVRFIVELPAADAINKTESPALKGDDAACGLPQGTPVNRMSLAEGTAHGMAAAPHVLVLEDEATVANLIADVLRDDGMNVDVAMDGPSALEAAGCSAYDLAICDLKMPGMDGQNFFAKLQESQNPLSEHVLFVTGDVAAPRTQQFLEVNRLRHVAKPFRVEELCDAVHQMLQRSGAGTVAPGNGDGIKQLGNGSKP